MLERAHTEVRSEGRLADAGLTAEEEVLAALDEVEGGVKLLVEVTIDRAPLVPVEVARESLIDERHVWIEYARISRAYPLREPGPFAT